MCSFGVILSQGPNERKVLSSIVSSNMTQMPVAAKHESTEQEEVDDGAGVDGAEVGPAAFAEEAANNPVEEDAPNTTADSQDGDDDNQAEHHKPYVGEEKTHEEAHHKTSLMLGVSAEMEQQNPAQTDGSPDPTKSKRPPGRPKGAKDSRPRTRRRKAEISAIRSATAAGMPVGMGMGFPHHQVKLLIACRSAVSVYEYDVAQVFQHHHMGGGHEMALQGMHGMDMSGYARPGFQGLRNMWGGGQDPSMGDMGMVPGSHAMSYKSMADPSGRGGALSQGGGSDGSVWSRGGAPGAGGVGGFADSVHMNSMYGSVDPYGFQSRSAGAGAGMYGDGHYDARYAPAAPQYGMSPMMMTSAMAMKQQHGGGHPSSLGRYGQHMRPGGPEDHQSDVAGHDGQV